MCRALGLEDDEGDLEGLRTRLAEGDAEIERGECDYIDSDADAEAFARDIHSRGLRRLANCARPALRDEAARRRPGGNI